MMNKVPCNTFCMIYRIACTFLVLHLGISASFATESASMPMYALVIGNSNYENKPLTNPKMDAELMANTLKPLGFNVKLLNDLNRKALFSSITDFYKGLPNGSVALVYYAGHGVQIGGANYLVPTEMSLTSERGIEINAYPLKAILDEVAHAKSSVNIVVLDACRNNPFQPGTSSKYRSISKLGLAKVTSPKGTIIAYSTAPGQLAEDGLGSKNSLYTATLAEEIKKSGVAIEVLLKKVANIVRKKTYDDQQPWYESSLVNDFYMIPPTGTQMLAPKVLTRPDNAKLSILNRNLTAKNMNANSEWYAQFNDEDWYQIDLEIKKRVANFTEDEIPQLLKQAKAGNVVAQTTLGLAYRDGITKIVDAQTGKVFRTNASNKKGEAMLRMAAEAGFPLAQTILGEMLYKGKAIERDDAEAEKWLELASRGGNFTRPKLDLMELRAKTPGDVREIAGFFMKQNNEVK